MRKLEFEPPPELRSMVGENLKAGQTMELMGKFQVKDDGDWCLVEVEGVAMPGYEDKAPGQGEYSKAVAQNMPTGYAAS